MNTFTIKNTLQTAWSRFKERPFFLVVLIIVMAVVSSFFGYMADELDAMPLLGFFASIGSVLVQMFLAMGVIYISLRVYDQFDVDYVDILAPAQQFLSFVGTLILYSLIVFGGLLLLVIPGIYWAIQFYFAQYAVIDQKLGPIEALKESKRLTDGSKWKLLALAFVVFALNLVGALLIVGMFVTIPITWLMYAHVYRTLQGKAGYTDEDEGDDVQSNEGQMDGEQRENAQEDWRHEDERQQ